ncbi:MAG: adenylate kinase [Bacteroidales bacterium]|nr:adenylate kinase [Bacteroidales bacterium]
MRKINIVMLGAPGSGKGTQAHKMAEKFNLAHISTGDLFRKNIAAGTPLGVEAQSYINRGALCPDSLTIDMLHDSLSKMPDIKGCILDGVPRTTAQADMLEGKGQNQQLPVDLVINLNVDQQEIAARMLKRAQLEGRSDDTPEIIEKRIANYFAQTKPLEDYYAQRGVLHQINGMGSVDDIFDSICKVIEAHL